MMDTTKNQSFSQFEGLIELNDADAPYTFRKKTFDMHNQSKSPSLLSPKLQDCGLGLFPK